MRNLRNVFVMASFCLGLGIVPALSQSEGNELLELSEKKVTNLTKAQQDSIALREANMAFLKQNMKAKKKEGKTQIANYSPMFESIEKVDTMEYRIDRTFSKEQLNELVLNINKNHTAILSYKEVAFDSNDEIIALELELIDSRLRESSYRVVPGTYMSPIRIYEYPDGRSGIKAIEMSSAQEPIPAEVLERMEAQALAEKERELLRIQRENNPITPRQTTKQPKFIVRSSSTIPDSLLPKKQRELRTTNFNH